MKIEGASPGRNTIEVSLPRPGGKIVTLMVSALPLGFWQQVKEWLPDASPPQSGFARDDDRKLLKDTEGRPIASYAWQDKKYLARQVHIGHLQNILGVAEALSTEPKVSFDAKPHKNRMEEYAEALAKEFSEFGFGDGDINALLRAVLKASSVSPKRIEKAREDFLSEAAETLPATSGSANETDETNST